jgi:hypothetical protein
MRALPSTKEAAVYARVVRFSDVNPERIQQIASQVEEAGGPPPGVDSTGFQLLVDQSQGTAVFIGYFDSEEKLREGSRVLEEMDAGDTPGTRVSADMCEVKLTRDA